MTRALRHSAIAVLAAASVAALVPAAGAKSVSTLRQERDAAQSKLEKKDGKARVLSSTIAGFTSKINGLQGGITTLRNRQAGVQAKLDGAVAELRTIQTEHRRSESRLAALKARLASSRKILARRLVQLYQSDRPDLLTVVLHSDGFAQLVEDREFLRRIGAQDRSIITTVAKDRAEMAVVAKRLAGMEARRQRVANEILTRRNEVAAVRNRLEARQQAWAGARAERQSALDSVKADSKALHDEIDTIDSDIASVTGQLQGSGGAVQAGPIRAGSGQFIWPIDGPITSPFCEPRAWESCHPGIDISASTGTPIRAAGGGTVQIAGWTGGYGNYTCIGHGGGVSTCYGHQSQINVSVGQSVSQGQIIGLVGSTGHSTGPHLHFEVRVNGSVTNPMGWL
ncbi:MAG: peptidoglycan DD-metalloendopeptidase family protein [Actinomycetes bacterium]